MPHPSSARRESCSCKDHQGTGLASKKSGPPKYCQHGWLLHGDPSKAINCGCLHEDIIESGNPYNRDPMDPTWTYAGSQLKVDLDEARKKPPSYCEHGKCIDGSE